MQSQQSSSKKREYENKILEFMTKTQQSTHTTYQSEPRPAPTHIKQKLKTSKPTQQSLYSDASKTLLNNPSKSSLKPQDSSKHPNTYRSKTLNRKNNTIPQSTQQQEISFAQKHKYLLEKIESRISEMNQKISQQISNEQNALLNQYAEKLKSKQQELNRLRKITNQEMINEKTIQRKEQLKREKENLIEGNHYYSQKLQELKKELNRLTEQRQFARKSLSVLMLDQPHQLQSIEKQPSQNLTLNKSRNRPVYFSSQDYVQKVLKKYNQKSQIINQPLTQSSFKKSQQNPKSSSYINTLSDKKDSFLPKILEKNKSLITSKSINPQHETEFYSYRKMKKRFDRAKSTGVFDNSLDISVDATEKIGLDNDDKLKKFFRYNNRDGSKTKDTTDIVKSSKVNQESRQRISNTSEIVIPKREGDTKFQYTKEYLQQFIVKKTTKETINKSPAREKGDNSPKILQKLKEKEKIITEKLEPPLKIQTLFQTATDEYYKYKQNQKKQKTQQSQSKNTNQQQIQDQSNLDNQAEEQKDKKRAQFLLEIKQFDKKMIMDLLLNHYNFKRYLYDLIVIQFEPKNARIAELHLQNVIRNFDSSVGIYTGKS